MRPLLKERTRITPLKNQQNSGTKNEGENKNE